MVSHLNRGAYWLVLLHLPGLGRSDMIKAAEFRIPSVYPGDPEEAVWDYRLLPGRKREYLLLALMPRPEAPVQTGSYLPLFHAVDLKLPGRGNEVTLFEKGITDTLRRSADDRYTLFSREENAPPLKVIPALPRRGYRGAFGGPGAHHLFLILLLCLLPALSFLTASAHGELQSRRALLALLERRTAATESSLEEEISLKQLGAGIRSTTPAAVFRQPPGPLGILQDLDRLLPPGTELHRLLCTEGRLQLELLGPAALEAAESLREEGSFNEVILGEIRPRNERPRLESYRIRMRIDR